MASVKLPREELPAADPHEGSGLDVREYLRVIWTYKWLILALTAVVGAAVIFWTLRQPKVYQATCTIEYDPNPTTPLGREIEDPANPIGSFWMSREFFATQNRIIASRTVAEAVVRSLHLHREPEFFGLHLSGEERARWEPRSVEEAAGVLQSRLTVEPLEDTRIVAIKVTDEDPERAATLANAVAQAYIDKTLRDRAGSTDRAGEWLAERSDELRSRLEASELALHRFKQEHNVLSVSMEDRQNLLAADITHHNTKLQEARSRRRQLEARAARIRALVESEDVEAAAAAFPENAALTAMRTELRAKIAQQESLSRRYGPNHQQMVTLAGEIAALREQMRRELRGLLRAAEADVAEVRRVEAGHRQDLEAAQQAGLELNLREIEYQRLNRERENNAKLYNLVLERSTETELAQRHQATHARLLDTALEPTTPISPSFTTNAAGGLGAGLALGLALAFLLSQLDRRMKSVADVEQAGLTVLGILPRIEEGDDAQPMYGRKNGKRGRRAPTPASTSRDLFVHTHPMSAAAECCRTIRTNLTFMSADDPIRTLVVTSANPREGKTTVTANVAISLAQSGKRVLLVDTDLRRPRLHRAFGVSSGRGVTSVIVGEARLMDVVQSTAIPNLDVLPCGPIPPNPSELLHSQRFAELVCEALQHYERVIFDSPPLAAVTDAAVLAPQLDAALVVVKAHATTRDALASALRQLRDVSANVVGGVLNDLDPRRKGYGAGDYYYYYRREGYYQADEDAPPNDLSRPAPPPS
ncbi:MAG TPA: polysaccharide biosynthesis tyrosine autokinase [Sandaracinaceae bacterium]